MSASNAYILKTDGGPHSAEKWAEATAHHIVVIGEHIAGGELATARKFELTVLDILEGHHTTVQTGERDKIGEIGHDRLLHDHDPEDHLSVTDVVTEIVAAAAGTPFESHFSQEFVQKYLTDLLTQHFSTSMNIERSWHADRHPSTPQACKFRRMPASEV